MTIMKNLALTVAVALLVIPAGFAILGTVAAEPTSPSANSAPGKTQVATIQDVQPVKALGPNYVDANGDGICDNQGAGAHCQRSRQDGSRRGYVDANGDGVCDNQGLGEQHRRRGRGQDRGQGRGHGNR